MAIFVSFAHFRMLLLTAAIAALVAAPSVAGATPQKRAPTSDAAKAQSAVCGAFGGYTTTSPGFDLQIDGQAGPKVEDTTTCHGGLLDGMTCNNYENFSNCTMSHQTGGSHVDQVTNDLAPLEASEAESQASAAADEPIVAVEQDPVVPEENDETVEKDDAGDEPFVDPTPAPVVDESVAPHPTVADPVNQTVPDAAITVVNLQPLETIEEIGVDSVDGQIA
jgi:hypothetical protein